MPLFGIIAGSGLYDIPGLEMKEEVRVSTPYGDPSDVFRIGVLSGREIAFLPRHGSPHRLQPHRIPYRANLRGFRDLGVERIISFSASGGINPDTRPGDLVLLDQVIDMTSGRDATYFDREQVAHVDFTDPFCPDLRSGLASAALQAGVALAGRGTYICANGPRLETAAEIRAFAMLGADVVGMTLMPEAALARELEICFAAVTVVTNPAAGISASRLTTKEVVETMGIATEKLKLLIQTFFGLPVPDRSCPCSHALRDATM